MQKSKMRFLASVTGILVAVFAGILVIQSQTNFISVSSTVNGRELPIYCVDTDGKENFHFFDAAWGTRILIRFWIFCKA